MFVLHAFDSMNFATIYLPICNHDRLEIRAHKMVAKLKTLAAGLNRATNIFAHI
jgi:hypothetical protein